MDVRQKFTPGCCNSAMIIDRIEALEALDHFGIRVVRAKYVDSAEDAIAFAARRDARDSRAVPIIMSVAGHEVPHSLERVKNEGPLDDPKAIRASYRFFAAAAEAIGDRVLAKEYVGAGTDITVAGRTDDDGRKSLALRCGEHGLERLVPLDEVGAEVLATHVLAHEHRGPREQQRRMLEHLVLRASALFEQPEIQALEFDPVRLHENMYTVLGATIEASSRLHLDKRLERHAHDRKGYGYHPSGRQ